MNIQGEKENTLRIAHYNILKGGEERLSDIFNVIKETDPDICGILEAVSWDKDDTNLQNITKEYGYEFFTVVNANSKYNIALISKYKVTVNSIKTNIKHVVLQVKIESGPFINLNIFFVHLSPVSEDERLLELKEISSHIINMEEVIIMGDFNSLSMSDHYNEENLVSMFRENNTVKYGTDQLHFDVINKIKELGFSDSMEYLDKPFNPSVPTSVNEDVNHVIPLRIDYAFLNPISIKNLTKSEFLKTPLSDKASDHYPLIIEIKK